MWSPVVSGLPLRAVGADQVDGGEVFERRVFPGGDDGDTCLLLLRLGQGEVKAGLGSVLDRACVALADQFAAAARAW